jgi:signal transduction histidine kinase
MEHELEAKRRVEQERVHLARELHDVLAHTVSVIGLQAGVAAEAIEDDDRVAAARAVESIRGTSREAMRDLRAALGLLRGEARAGEDDGRAPVGSVGHLEPLADTARATGLDVRLDLSTDLPPLTAAVDATVYRVVQESLTNVLRHSGAQHVVVRLARGDGYLDITVTDDGGGVADGSEDGAVNGGHGIRGMRERVALVGGRLEAGPVPSGGFAVRVRLPL